MWNRVREESFRACVRARALGCLLQRAVDGGLGFLKTAVGAELLAVAQPDDLINKLAAIGLTIGCDTHFGDDGKASIRISHVLPPADDRTEMLSDNSGPDHDCNR